MMSSLPMDGRRVIKPSRTINSSVNYAQKKLQFITWIFVLLASLTSVQTFGQSCTGFRTQTQGGWGAKPSGGNPGVYLHANFSDAFPNGLTIGCASNTLTLSTAQDITDLLPTGGGASALPTISVIVGQLVSAELSVGFDLHDASFGSNAANLQDLVIASGPFSGWTISQLLIQANLEIGGCSSTYSLSDINDALDNINNNYDDGTSNDGFLNCPTTCNSQLSGITTDVTCHGSTNGSIDVTVTGTTGTVTYLWNDGATTQDRTGLGAGTYSVTATDSHNCTASGSFTVHQPDQLGMSGVVTDVTITNGSDGSIDVTVTGGTSPYTYLWNDGVTTEDRSNLTAGTYSVTVTDHNGCPATQSFTVHQPGCTLSMDGQRLNVTCHGSANGSIDVTVSGAQGTVTYLWNDGATTEDRNNLAPGGYSVTATDQGGCTANKSFTITEPDQLGMSGVVTDVTITNGSNGSIDVTVTGGTTPYTYLWNDGVTTEDRSNLTAGTYSVTVTDHNGCPATQSFTVHQPGCTLSMDGQKLNVTCHGSANGSIDVTVSGAQGTVTYLWNDGATTEDRSNLAPGGYSVTATDQGGCTANKSFTITEPDQLGMSGVVTDVTIINGSNGSIDVTVTGGTAPYTYLWNDGVTTEDRSNLTAGTYSVTVTDHNGCPATQSFTVHQPQGCTLTVNAGPDLSRCHAGSSQLNATASQPGATFSWSPSTGLNNSHIANPTSSVKTTTTYTVTATVGNCTATDQVTLTVYPLVKAGITAMPNDATCATPCVHLKTAFNAEWTYSWRVNNHPAPGDTHTNTYCACAPGTYSVQVMDVVTGCNHNSKPYVVTISHKLEDPQSTEESTNVNFTAWPNPTSDVLNVTINNQVDENTIVELTDMFGRVISSVHANGQNQTITFDAHSLAAGVYFVRLTSGNIKEVQKVIVSK